jgi:hypothetical protein
MTRLRTFHRSILRPGALWLAAAAAALVRVTAGSTGGGALASSITVVRRRFNQLRTARDGGLSTVEIAIITAVLLGLATALAAAITVVVARNTSKIR